MAVSANRQKLSVTGIEWLQAVEMPLTIHPLSNKEEPEVLAFLAARPVHTVIMDGFIRDNGLKSELNRGTFYGCRDARGKLEGVALIGHATLIETRSEAALAAFARFARNCPFAYMVLGESVKIATFWNHFAQGKDRPRRVCRELLFEQKYAGSRHRQVQGLRLATPDDLSTLLPLYAQLHFEESGVNMLETDPKGYRRRWLRRIEQNRVWVWMRDGQLIFNADIVSKTPSCVYLRRRVCSPGGARQRLRFKLPVSTQ